MQYDLENFNKGLIDDHSDGVRLASWKVGYTIFKENSWFGVGTGDILSTSKKCYDTLFPSVQKDSSRKMPHNQFLWVLASMGIVGFIGFCVAYLAPFFLLYKKANWLWWILQLIFFSSFMTEYSLEEQIGGTFNAVFSLVFFKYFTENDE